MLRHTRYWAAAAGLALTLALATPGLASAHPAQPSVIPTRAQAFPSATSTVIASEGFINGTEVGYFWSQARGDSVEQTLPCRAHVTRAVLKLSVPENTLSGSNIDWTLSINGTDVGNFTITPGQTGPVTEHYSFARMSTGRSCDTKIRVTNEVPAGDGSISLTYAGSDPHSIKLR
jgi:hypothetical protein